MIPKNLKKIGRFVFWSFFVFFLLFVIIYYCGAKEAGHLEAKYDLWKGRYEIRTYGLQGTFALDASILKANGIDYVQFAGCMVNNFIIRYVAGYNFVMAKAIKRDLEIDVKKLLNYGDATVDIKQRFYEKLSDLASKGSVNEVERPSTILCKPEPKEGENTLYEIGPCSQTVEANIDSDDAIETLCFRTLKYREYDETHINFSLLVDIFKAGHKVVRQELNRTFYYKEEFVLLQDIDKDGKSELVTKVTFGPDCAGDQAFRIYKFKKSSFDLVLNVFGVPLDNPFIKTTLTNLPGFKKRLLDLYQEKRPSEHLCIPPEELIKSDPWLIDPDHIGKPGMLLLLVPPYELEANTNDPHFLFLAVSSAETQFSNFDLNSVEIEFRGGFIDLLGFITTKDHRTHLLLNFACSGNSGWYPILHVLNVHSAKIEKIGKFPGFYEHTIPERLRDLDGDGNPEIIYVKNLYWPSGKPHSDIIPEYGIGRYRNGKYVQTDVEFIMPLGNE